MFVISCDKFSAKDLLLFIESIEQITRLEAVKKQREQMIRARYLADTLRYLGQQDSPSSSSTLSFTDRPLDESVMESFEHKHIPYYSTCMATAKPIHYASVSCHTNIYSVPFECQAFAKLEERDYETLDLKPKEKEVCHLYEVPRQMAKKSTKAKSKFSLINLISKKCRKCFAKETNNCQKSESWTMVTIV